MLITSWHKHIDEMYTTILSNVKQHKAWLFNGLGTVLNLICFVAWQPILVASIYIYELEEPWNVREKPACLWQDSNPCTCETHWGMAASQSVTHNFIENEVLQSI